MSGMNDLLTPDELEAIDLLSRASSAIRRVIGVGPHATHDWADAATWIHNLQHAVMAQAAARAYPDRFRLLGQDGEWSK